MSDPIQHVVVLMLENRSFDQMLGDLKSIRPDVDGIDRTSPARNTDGQGNTYLQEPTATRRMRPDPKHDTRHVLAQIDSMDFVRNYVEAYGNTTRNQRQQVISYFPWGSLPAIHTLAEHFMVCDAWFCSVPGPTWANRLFAWSGTSLGHVEMPESLFNLNLHNYNQPTLFDRLNEKSRKWRVYQHGGISLTFILKSMRRLSNLNRVDLMNRFDAAASGPESEFPEFAFIEPCYLGPQQNDDHPDTDVMRGQALIAHVYNKLRANEELWKKTLLVILYDEHGGFYDHVRPPQAVPPDAHNEDQFAFNRLGVRVPAVLVSPWLDPGVCHEQFDHTSLLKYISDKWDLGPLGARVAASRSFGALLTQRDTPRTDTPQSIKGNPGPVALMASAITEFPPPQPGIARLTDNQRAIVALSQMLEADIGDTPELVGQRMLRMLEGGAAQEQVAVERFSKLLARAHEQA